MQQSNVPPGGVPAMGIIGSEHNGGEAPIPVAIGAASAALEAGVFDGGIGSPEAVGAPGKIAPEALDGGAAPI